MICFLGGVASRFLYFGLLYIRRARFRKNIRRTMKMGPKGRGKSQRTCFSAAQRRSAEPCGTRESGCPVLIGPQLGALSAHVERISGAACSVIRPLIGVLARNRLISITLQSPGRRRSSLSLIGPSPAPACMGDHGAGRSVRPFRPSFQTLPSHMLGNPYFCLALRRAAEKFGNLSRFELTTSNWSRVSVALAPLWARRVRPGYFRMLKAASPPLLDTCGTFLPEMRRSPPSFLPSRRYQEHVRAANF